MSNKELTTIVPFERQDYHVLTPHQVEKVLNTNIRQGLTSDEAKRRLEIIGENSLGEDNKINTTDILIRQIFNPMILVLVISVVITLAIKDWISGGVIFFVVFLNVFIGTIQEYRASKTMQSLKSLSTPSAHVIRDGDEVSIESRVVVPGDICMVKVGDKIAADLRLVDSVNFETEEMLLTGEAFSIEKDHTLQFELDTPIGDRLNLAYASCTVSRGRAVGIVTKTGLNTEVGMIAKSLKEEKLKFNKGEDKGTVSRFVLGLKHSVGTFLGINVGTPLQQKLSKLALLLFVIAVVFALIVFATQRFRINREVAVYAICVALSMIPSSLVVVLTITMLVGAKVMSMRNVIVRNLKSLEALGSVNDICSDKTGTLTQGKMIAKQVWIPDFGTLVLNESNFPYDPTVGELHLIPRFSPWEYQHDDTEDVGIIKDFREVWLNGKVPDNLNTRLLENWLRTATLANIATVFQDTNSGDWKAHGDPTEVAIQVFSTRMGMPYEDIVMSDNGEKEEKLVPNATNVKKTYIHLAEFPFDSSIKRMSTVYLNTENKNLRYVFTKGAFERVLDCCTRWRPNPDDESSLPLTEDDIKIIKKNVDTLSTEGLRVLAFGTKYFTVDEAKDLDSRILKDRDFVEKDLVFQGIIGIYDPARPETKGAVKKCHKAGINVHMLTGDFAGTAKAIAQEVGILPHNLYHYPKEVVDSMFMTAAQFNKLSDEEIDKLPLLPLVIARCAPQTKVRMIDALHRRNKFCAMTGDGVNDSPSLKKANVGIAMGVNGSDVAKEASDIVLSDDNFASILNAVEEGRRMSDNIQKFVLQLLATNVAQALYLMIGLVFLDEDGVSVFPLSPVEALWIIVVTSCFPAMGLGVEKAAPDIMDKPPKDSKDNIFTLEIIVDMLVYGVTIAVCCLACFTIVVYGSENNSFGNNCNIGYNESCKNVFKGRATTFATLTWCPLILAWEVIDMRRSLFAMLPDSETPYTQVFRDIWSNQFLFWSIIFGFVTVFPIVYIPVINRGIFLHTNIGHEWALAFAFSILFWIVVELWKYVKRVYFRNKGRAINPETDLEKTRVNDPFEKYNTTFSKCTTGTIAPDIIKKVSD